MKNKINVEVIKSIIIKIRPNLKKLSLDKNLLMEGVDRLFDVIQIITRARKTYKKINLSKITKKNFSSPKNILKFFNEMKIYTKQDIYKTLKKNRIKKRETLSLLILNF